jgi:hypothetical protein
MVVRDGGFVRGRLGLALVGGAMNRDDWIALLRAAVFAALLVLPALALALANAPRLPVGATCDDVRANVKRYGWVASYAWAKLQGYSSKEIAEAKRCLR